MIHLFLCFIIGTVFSACCLWAGMKLTKVDGTFREMAIIAAISTIIGFIPQVGWVLSTIAMYYLICKWTDAKFWPDAVLMVIVAQIISIFAFFLLNNPGK